MIVRSIILAAAIASSTAATAQEATIRYRAYELGTSEGREAIAQRVKKAVRNACRNSSYPGMAGRCRGELSSELLSKIGNEEVAAVYNHRPVRLASRD